MCEVGITRRRFLQGSGALATAFLLPGTPRLARAAAGNAVLVAVYLRGGADGLHLVAPIEDPAYYELRPDVRVKYGTALYVDDFYAFHPALAPLVPLFFEGDLAVVHAVGGTPGLRSHFEAQDRMERAASGELRVEDGWLNRALVALAAGEPWAGITLGPATALALSGSSPSLALGTLAELDKDPSARQSALRSMYLAAPEPLARAATEAFESLDALAAVGAPHASLYPPSAFGAALADAAALIRADLGVRVVVVDFDGWDHHQSAEGLMARLAPELAGGLAAFRADLGAHWSRTCVLVMSEFGRAVKQNGSFGTDHGSGGVMFAAGAGVRGGRVLTRNGWPGLAPANLFEGRDLAVTTDYRDVFAELLHRHMGLPLAALPAVLPGHAVAPSEFPGLFA
jgi:uncharacterized protein (DUF1501 family)